MTAHTPAAPAAAADRLPAAIRLLTDTLDPAAILLFGSHAAGRATGDSDFDFAVLLGRPAPDFERLAALRVDLEDLLRAPADVVILDDASPILVMEVLRCHRPLALRDAEALEHLVVRTVTDYADLKRVRQPIEAALLAPPS